MSERADVWLELSVTWRGQALTLVHLSETQLRRSEGFWVGEDVTAGECAFVVPELPVRHRLLSVDASGEFFVHAAPTGGREAPPARVVTLGSAAAVERVGALEFSMRCVRRERSPAGVFAPRVEGTLLASLGASFGLAGAVFAALALSAPPSWALDDALHRERVILAQQLLSAAAERELEAAAGASSATPSQAAPAERTLPAVQRATLGPRARRWVAGSAPGQAGAEAPRGELLHEARQSALANLLTSSAPLDVPWANTLSAGQLELADAGMFSAGVDERSGGGRLSGPGYGSGIRGAGLGLDGIAGLPGGGGDPRGRWGLASGRRGAGHGTGVPTLRMVPASVSGRLPPEVIQRVVRQNFGRLRLCYEEALRRSPALEGRLEVRFVIGTEGRVQTVSAGGGLPDTSATSCVVSAFYGLSFPEPEAGTVRVTYPITFTPRG